MHFNQLFYATSFVLSHCCRNKMEHNNILIRTINCSYICPNPTVSCHQQIQSLLCFIWPFTTLFNNSVNLNLWLIVLLIFTFRTFVWKQGKSLKTQGAPILVNWGKIKPKKVKLSWLQLSTWRVVRPAHDRITDLPNNISLSIKSIHSPYFVQKPRVTSGFPIRIHVPPHLRTEAQTIQHIQSENELPSQKSMQLIELKRLDVALGCWDPILSVIINGTLLSLLSRIYGKLRFRTDTPNTMHKDVNICLKSFHNIVK
jgi:hypothetical protein